VPFRIDPSSSPAIFSCVCFFLIDVPRAQTVCAKFCFKVTEICYVKAFIWRELNEQNLIFIKITEMTIESLLNIMCGSAVGIATGYRLDNRGVGSEFNSR
jgi:hypothetical protein